MKITYSITFRILAAVVWMVSSRHASDAFSHKATTSHGIGRTCVSETRLCVSTEEDQMEQNSRRKLFTGALTALGAVVMAPVPAIASYSAYSRREQDWQERSTNGEVQYKTARDLKQQLREIVPQNSESSKVFCPNGPTANVSPLMENKCGDRLALPSVYGRTEDIVGNSIPGFSGGRYTAQMQDQSTPLSAEVGFPAYGFAVTK